ncbi:MAG: hypothetical protein NDI94_04020 [Candidatus Woesearchaeota archaeon]|nr:hypothetical protein [Candidatus Woesearchaeota archaeon]
MKKINISELTIIRAWLYPKSFFYGLFVIVITLLWPSVPLKSLGVWVNTLFNTFPTNLLYLILTVLSGSFTALYVYKKNTMKVCNISKSGSFASLFGVVLGACPACVPALGFILPLSLTITLSYLSWVILLASIIMLFFVIYNQGGFKRELKENG